MTRLARMVIPGLPHHVTQRGNRREAIFFEDGDHEIYCDMLAEQLRKSSVGDLWPDGTGTLGERCQRTEQELEAFSDGHYRTKRLGMAVLFRKIPFRSDHESKVYADDWRDKVRDAGVFCPFCGHTAEATKWNTEQQNKYFERPYAHLRHRVGRAMKRDSQNFNRRQSMNGFIRMIKR